VKGEVVSLMSYGAFVRLEDGIEGLVHVSEMSWTRRINHPSEIVNVGDAIDVVILEIDKEKLEISLGMKQTEVNPWDMVAENYPPGTVIRGKVRNLTNYGAFVELEDGIDGMVHVSDMSWTRRINNPAEVMKKGDDVEAIVLDVDVDQQRISLGVKQTQTDPWSEIDRKYRIGDLVNGKVSKIANFGAFIELSDEIDGLVHVSQLAEQRVENVKDVVKVGQDVTARVIKIDKEDRRIGLSIKAANYDAERLQAEITSYDRIKGPSTGGAPAPSAGGSSSSSSGSGDFNSLGDLLDKAGN
jgi:small subunit ribosomal protein S1